jgi:hypothetical protein
MRDLKEGSRNNRGRTKRVSRGRECQGHRGLEVWDSEDMQGNTVLTRESVFIIRLGCVDLLIYSKRSYF